MRKRILSLILCLVMLISSVPVQVFATEELPSEWEFADGILSLGSNSVQMVSGAEYSLIEFYPEETGVYTFTGPSGSKLANFNASFFPNNITGDAASDTLEWTCTSVGQSLLLGICAAGDSVTVSIARTGNYVSHEIQYTVYENTHTPNAANKAYCAKVSGKVTPSDTLVKKGDRYYTQSGEAVFVNFSYTNLSISAMLGTSPARYLELDDEGNAIVALDYYDALSAYAAMGNYPLTTDLVQMLEHLDIAKGWTDGGWLNGWQELCFLVKDHQGGEPVVEGNLANTYCTGCNKLLHSEEAKPKEPYAFGSQKLTVGTNTVTLNSGAVYTLNKFNPTETGVYTFEAPAGVKLAYYNTSFNPMDMTGDAAANTLEWTCSAVGQQMLLGVSGSGESVAVTITRTGDYVSQEIQYTIYENVHTPSKENTDYCANVGGWFSVPQVVQVGDRFYGVTVDGAYIPMFVDLAYTDLSLTTMLETSSAKYVQKDENGKIVLAYNYYDALKAYTAFGKYPLTVDLMQMLQHLDVAKGWTEGGWLEGWQELCFLASEHMAGLPEIDGDLAKYYCTGCGKLLKTEEAPKEDCIAKGTTGEVEWKITLEGQLVFFGQGATGNYNEGDYLTGEFIAAPWAEYADQITGIVIENGVTEIGEAVFVGLNRVTEIVIPEGVTCIGADAFANCENLKTVSIPASANLSYYNAFCNCPSLENVWVAEGNPYYYDIDGVVFWIQMHSETEEYGRYVYYYPSGRKSATYTIPEDVDLLGVACFRGTQYLEEAILHEGMYWSDGFSFQNSSIKTISIPAAMECFTGQELAYCKNLETVYFLGDFPYIDRWDKVGLTDATFEGTTTTCYYPAGNETWTEDRLQNYGGTLTWVPYSEECQHPNLKHVEAVAATCMAEGNMEYWHCQDCGKFWKDEALTQVTNHKNVIVPAAEHDLVHVEAVAASCMAEGNIEHWYCNVCEIVWQDEALTQITNHKNVIIPVAAHDLVHVKAVEATCMNEGNIAHWYCNVCEVVWQDEALTQITNHKNVIIPVAAHDLVHVKAVEATCMNEGNIEHWYCNVCEIVWQDEALTQVTNHKNVIIPKNETAHSWGEWGIVEDTTCTASGTEARKCEYCAAEETREIPMLDHVDKNGDVVCDSCGTELGELPGSINNPEILVPDQTHEVMIPCGNTHYLRWTVPENGILTLEVGGKHVSVWATSTGMDPNQNDFADKRYSAEVPNRDDGISWTWDVVAGEIVNLELSSIYEDEDTKGSVRISFVPKTFEPGSQYNPMVLQDENQDTIPVAECTVTIPAGQTYWFDVSNVANSTLQVEAVEGVVIRTSGKKWDADENGMISAIIEAAAALEIENTTDAEVTLALNFAFEEGYEKNPAPLELGSTEFYIAPYQTYGRYFTWTAPADGSFTFGISSETLWQYRISSETVIGQLHTAEDEPCVDTETWEVKSGDQLTIHVIGYAYAPDLVVGYPGIFQVTASFEAAQAEIPGNTPEEFILVEFAMNEEETAGTASVTVEPGIWYYGAYIAGMELTANGESVELTPAQPRKPAIFCFTNQGTEAVTYELVASYPLGSMSNPAALTLGENVAPIQEGNDQGYFYTWTAEASGTLTLTMPQSNWFYTLNNLTSGVYGDMQYSTSNPVVAAPQLEVSAGDQIQVIVNNYDPANPWTAPAGDLVFQASFEKAVLLPLALIPMIGEPAEVVKHSDGSYTVYLDKEDVAELPAFSIMSQTLEPITKKDLKWTTSDSRIASVKSDAYSPIGNVTLKQGAEGACVITAQNVKTKDVAAVTIVIRSYEPRLETASLSLNSNAHAGAQVALTESYGNAITGVTVHEYDSKAKGYAEEASQRLIPAYEDGILTVTHGQPMKKGSYKLLLKVSCANGETYEYPVTLKVTETLPTVTIKQLNKFNTFYTDSEAQFLITSKDGVIAGAELFFGENPAFQGEFDTETGILTLRYSEAYLKGETKLGVKGDIMVFFQGYWIPVEKATTISTEKKAPKVFLDAASSTINTALGEASVTLAAFYGELGNMTTLEDILKVDAGTFAEAEVTQPHERAEIKLTLTGKKGGTAKIYVQAENWNEPVMVSHKISVQTKQPGLKFDKKDLRLNNVLTDIRDMMEVSTDQGNVAVESITVEPVSKSEKVLAEIAKLRLDVMDDCISVSLDPENAPKKGTYEFKATAIVGEDTAITKNFKVVVEEKVPTVKAASATLKLNTQLGTKAYAETGITVSGLNGMYRLADLVPEKENENFQVSYDPETGILRAALTNDEAKNGKHSVKLYPKLESSSGTEVVLSKAVTVNVQIFSGKPAVTVKATGKLDTIVPDSAIAYTITKLSNIAGVPEAVRLEGQGAELFRTELLENGALVKLNPDAVHQKDKTYKLKLVFTIDGMEVPAAVSVKVSQSSVKFAAVKTLNYYQGQSGRMALRLEMTAPAGASVGDITLGSQTAKQLLAALGEDAITWIPMADGTCLVSIQVENPGQLTYGKSYNLFLDVTPAGNAENAKPTSLKIAVKVAK